MRVFSHCASKHGLRDWFPNSPYDSLSLCCVFPAVYSGQSETCKTSRDLTATADATRAAVTGMLREEEHETANSPLMPQQQQQQQRQQMINRMPDEAMSFPAPPQGPAFVPFQLSDEMCKLLP